MLQNARHRGGTEEIETTIMIEEIENTIMISLIVEIGEETG